MAGLWTWSPEEARMLLGGAVMAAALLATAFASRLLLDYARKWQVMKPIPGPSPCYPVLGSATLLDRDGAAFLQQLLLTTEGFRAVPLLKLWLGPLPMLVLYHADTVEVIAEKARELKKQEEHKRDSVGSSEQRGRKVRRAFLDMLLNATDEDGKKMSYLDIREEVDTFMFAGHDTAATAMNWTVYLLASNPGAQRNVHRELDEVFGDSDRYVTMDDLKNLWYLECVIKEALRLFPSIPFFGRTINEECYISQRFALMEEKIVLATVLRHLWIETMQRRDELTPVVDVILRPHKGIWIQLKRRPSSIP